MSLKKMSHTATPAANPNAVIWVVTTLIVNSCVTKCLPEKAEISKFCVQLASYTDLSFGSSRNLSSPLGVQEERLRDEPKKGLRGKRVCNL